MIVGILKSSCKNYWAHLEPVNASSGSMRRRYTTTNQTRRRLFLGNGSNRIPDIEGEKYASGDPVSRALLYPSRRRKESAIDPVTWHYHNVERHRTCGIRYEPETTHKPAKRSGSDGREQTHVCGISAAEKRTREGRVYRRKREKCSQRPV